MDKEQQFNSPAKKPAELQKEKSDFETGFRTPEISKDKVEQLKARKERIGNMSSFFKRTAVLMSSQSDCNSSKPAITLDEYLWPSKINSFSNSIQKMPISSNKEVRDSPQEEIVKKTTKVKLPSSQFSSILSQISLFENQNLENEAKISIEKKEQQKRLHACEVCNVKTRFTRAILSCCATRTLCLRCYDHYCLQYSPGKLVCPFCEKSNVEVERLAIGLFSPFASKDLGQSESQAEGYPSKSLEANDEVSM